jgi:ribonuclease P protein component
MRSSNDFSSVTRHGRRARSGGLVVYLSTEAGTMDGPARVGLIVGSSVGGSVVRHQVSRRLRAQLSARLTKLPAGSRVVVRALPELAKADSASMGRNLDKILEKLLIGSPHG